MNNAGWTTEELATLSHERLSAMVRDGEISQNAARRAMYPKTSPDPASRAAESSPVVKDLEFTIARLDLRQGDILVVRCKERLSMEAVERMKSVFKMVTGDHKIMVLENGADLAVLTAADIAARTA